MRIGQGSEERLWFGVVTLLAVVLAGWMDLSAIHRHHNADSIVQILVSLVRWTPFFWEQNRYGMLLPFLALPFDHPFHNLLFQVWLRLLALVACFFLLARVVAPRSCWPAVGAVSLGLFLTARSPAQICFLLAQPYPQAMALALGGVLLLDAGGRVRKAAGSLLVALAFWVSLSTLFWLAPLLALRRLLSLEPGERRGFYPFLLVGASFAASLAASVLDALFGYGGTDLAPVRMADWPRGWAGLAQGALRDLSPGWVVTAGLLLAAAAGLSLAGQRRGRPALAAGLCLTGAAAGEIAFLGTSAWIHLMNFDVRFILSGLIALTVASPALLLSLTLDGRPAGWRTAANVLALAALLPIVLLHAGPPSLERARRSLDAGLGRHSSAILAGGGTHVLGNFWRVWPAVFHTNLTLFERGEERRVWGITFRSGPTRSLWQRADWTAARFAALGADREIEAYRSAFGLPPLFRKADLGRVEIHTIHPPAIRAHRSAHQPPMADSQPAGAPGPPLDFHTLRPCRLFDTLQHGALVSGEPPLRIQVAAATCGVPAGARAVAANVQAILPACAGRLVLFPADRPAPPLATLAFAGGDTVASFQILPLSEHGDLAAAATLEDGGDVRLLLDVSGYFADE